MKSSLSTISKLRVSYLVFMAITGCWAICMSDTTLNRPAFLSYLPFILYFFDSLFLIFVVNRHLNYSDVLLIAVPIISFLLYITNVYNYDNYSPNALYFYNLVVFAFTADYEKLKAFKIIRYLFVVSCFGGIIAYISYVFNLGIPYSTVPYYTEETAIYADFKFAYVMDKFGIVRLCGLMNEPGLLGTLVALLLISDNYNLKKMSNIILFISALLTMSAAFFFLSIVFFVIRFRNSIKGLLLLGLTIGMLMLFIFYFGVNNDTIYALTVEKFGNGVFELRSNSDIDSYYDKLTEEGKLLWGYGNGFTRKHIAEGASWKNVVLDFGYAGMIILYLPLFFTAITKSKHNKSAILLSICFFVSIYQRTNIFNPIYFLLLFGGIQYILMEKRMEFAPPPRPPANSS